MNRREAISAGLAFVADIAGVGRKASPLASAAPQYSEAIQRFRKIPRLRLPSMSTPLERCDRLRATIAGAPHIYIKRDDYIGFLVGGNKVRKLDYLLADAKMQQATTILTVGPIQSNHARTTAMVASRLGLKCGLILSGVPPAEIRGNFYIDKLLNIPIRFVSSKIERNPMMDTVARELESKGEQVYKIPLGGTNEIGSFGFVAALEELRREQPALLSKLTAIVFASSAGGTQCGLEVGKRLFHCEQVSLIGVSPDDNARVVKENVLGVTNKMMERLGMRARLTEGMLIVDDRQVGGGYRIPTSASREAARVFRETEGILLDPVYTSKAAAALLQYCREGRFKPDDHVLFWHTGGLVAMFEYGWES
jgi:L-cysteate sulfo-lyase